MKKPIASVVLFLAAASSPALTIFIPKTVREAQYINAGYSAWSATITRVGPPAEPNRPGSKRAITLHVDRVYAGAAKAGDDADRDYVEPNDDPDQLPEWRDAWQGVSARVGEKVLVLERYDRPIVMAAEPDASPVAVKIRELILLDRRAQSSPKIMLDRIESLRPNADQLETLYLIDAPAARLPPEAAAFAIATLMEKDGFTPGQRTLVAINFALAWARCTPEGKAKSMQQLLHVAASPQFEKARPALVEVFLIHAQTHDEFPQLNPAVDARLRTNYEKYVAQGNARNVAFEASLNRAVGAR